MTCYCRGAGSYKKLVLFEFAGIYLVLLMVMVAYRALDVIIVGGMGYYKRCICCTIWGCGIWSMAAAADAVVLRVALVVRPEGRLALHKRLAVTGGTGDAACLVMRWIKYR